MLRRAEVSPLGHGKVLYLKGSPYEQGKQLGRGAADLIRDNLARTRTQRGEINSGRDRTDYDAVTRSNEKFVERTYPDLIEEITGMAEGAEVDYLELLSMNLNVQLSYVWSTVEQCTQVLAMGEATVDGKTYIGKTRDLARGPVLQVVLHREYEDGSFSNEMKTAGRMTVLDGVNQDGVSLTCSGQWSPRVRVDVSRASGAWLMLNLGPILRGARSAEEAVRMIEEQPRAAGMNVLVADESKAFAVEVTDRAVRVHEPERGMLVRTNHFFSPDFQEIVPSRQEYRGTYDRHARATELLRGYHGRVSAHNILRILSDHSEMPVESICRHGLDGQSRTWGATINCPQERTMSVILGNPCEHIQTVGRPGD